jgi:hypothetical protein
MNGKITTLPDFQDNLTQIGDKLLMIVAWWQFSGKICQINNHRGINLVPMNAMFDAFVGGLWGFYCDDDDRTLGFRVYLTLTNQSPFRHSSRMLNVYRNNVTQHFNNEAFSPLQLNAVDVNGPFQELIDTYKEMCSRFNDSVALSAFNHKLHFIMKVNITKFVLEHDPVSIEY